MSLSRVDITERNLDGWLESAPEPPALLPAGASLREGSALTARRAIGLFEDMALSRALDVASRELKKTNRSFYTISSAGHEMNVCAGALLRPTDPALVHYRSGAFLMARARQVPGQTPVFDTLLSFCASREDPISRGRHKVWGSKALLVPPKTSTIGSHLPKASGLAFALALARRLGVDPGCPEDAIVCCSFGDASANHATALAGVQSARYVRRRGGAVPLLLLCEDNGIGISVETPRGWIEDLFANLKYLRYVRAEGDLASVFESTREAIDACRASRGPVLLHLKTVRLWGHAGSDVETTYRTLEEIAAVEAQDPLLATARFLVGSGAASPAALRALLRDTRNRVLAAAEEAAGRPKLSTLAEVTATLAPFDAEKVRETAEAPVDPERRAAIFADGLPERATAPTKRTLAAQINHALHDLMLQHPGLVVFGEDVGKKGGVYYVTAGLQKRFGALRCFDTLLDETTILGLAQGAAQAGLLPCPEIQYLAYVHNAIDQIRGEACSLSFFSSGQFTNPMVIRVQGLAYQKGFGGHFHNDNAVGALREIPGLLLAVPSRGDDAVRMLRGLFATARECGRVCLFLEPIALYHEKDLHEEGDGLWLADYPPPGSALLPGETGVRGAEHGELLLVSYGNGHRLSLRAARILERDHSVKARVLDLRWLNPLPLEEVRRHAFECGAVVVADECRATGAGIADAVVADLAERGYRGRILSCRSADSYVPLGPATAAVLLSETDIVETSLEALR
jgi:2-oxoisovalerate dehydrogenase E1 component